MPMCDTDAKMPTIRKTMKTINMRARRVSITDMISAGALSVNNKEILTKYSPGARETTDLFEFPDKKNKKKVLYKCLTGFELR